MNTEIITINSVTRGVSLNATKLNDQIGYDPEAIMNYLTSARKTDMHILCDQFHLGLRMIINPSGQRELAHCFWIANIPAYNSGQCWYELIRREQLSLSAQSNVSSPEILWGFKISKASTTLPHLSADGSPSIIALTADCVTEIGMGPSSYCIPDTASLDDIAMSRRPAGSSYDARYTMMILFLDKNLTNATLQRNGYGPYRTSKSISPADLHGSCNGWNNILYPTVLANRHMVTLISDQPINPFSSFFYTAGASMTRLTSDNWVDDESAYRVYPVVLMERVGNANRAVQQAAMVKSIMSVDRGGLLDVVNGNFKFSRAFSDPVF